MSHIVMVKAVAYGVVTVRCFLRSSVAYLEEAKLLLITRSCCSALVRMIALREEAARVKCHRGLMFRAWRLSFGAARMRDRRIAAKVFERPDSATSFGSYVVLGGQAGLCVQVARLAKRRLSVRFFSKPRDLQAPLFLIKLTNVTV